MKTIDLFSGGGGFSLGAHRAGLETAIAVDVDPNLSSSYLKNFPRANHMIGDLSSLDLTHSIRNLLGTEPVSCVIGGPPCQGFSLIGKRDNSDPRNDLLGAFFRHVTAIQPHFFVMENVPGLLISKDRSPLQKAMSLLEGNYRVLPPMVLNAADFGAATSRQRVVVIGYNPNYLDEVLPEHFLATTKATTVLDAIGDLPSPRMGNQDDDRKLGPNRPVSAYVKKLNRLDSTALASEKSRHRFSNGIVSGFLSTRHSVAVQSRFAKTKQGHVEPISRYTRLSWNSPAPVLRAGTGSDRGSFQAARPIHPKYNRVITVREAARIQGFPDWYDFHPTKWHSHRMIGNSVSPIFAEAILSALVARYTVLHRKAA